MEKIRFSRLSLQRDEVGDIDPCILNTGRRHYDGKKQPLNIAGINLCRLLKNVQMQGPRNHEP